MFLREARSLLIVFLLANGAADAQDLVITNARVVVGNGTVVANGAVVVKDGKIVSAGPAAPAGAPGQGIDARGMTVMPGFIDAHRHIINGNDQQWFKDQATVRMREFLEAGYTTLMSGGGPVPGIITLTQRVESGELVGPRIITSGRVDPDANPQQRATLAAITDEARKHRPLDLIYNVLNVRVTIKGGKIVHDARR